MTRDMQDKLEKFVKDNKSEFDSLTPKDKVWDGIHNELEASSNANLKMVIWRAAAIILFVLSIGLTFYTSIESILKSSSDVVYDTEFLISEEYYTSVINERQQVIALVANTYPEVKIDFELDWEILDESYAKLKEEYARNESKEVLNALVQNLRLRVSLLNKQIEILISLDSDNKNILDI